MVEAAALAVAVPLAAWWCASAVNQVETVTVHRLRRRDRFGLLPRWTFFAPHPAQTDLRLLWREETDAGWGAWSQYPAPLAGPATRWAFNPDLVRHKGLADICGAVVRSGHTLGPDAVMLSAPYVTLLAAVTALPAHGRPVRSRQFAVVSSAGPATSRRLAVLFISHPHPTAQQPTPTTPTPSTPTRAH